MPKTQSSAISFGLVFIPVGLYPAAQDQDIRFNQLDKDDLSRVRYKKMAGAEDGHEREVTNEDIVKGYEFEKDRYVVLTEQDFEKIKTEQDKNIHILQFVSLQSIPVVYFQKPYYVLPEKGGERAFELLREAMIQENKVAIGKSVLGTREVLLALIPQDFGLLLETMYFEAEIKDLPKNVDYPAPGQEELAMAKKLIQGMFGSFEPSLYKDEYQERLRVLIEDKIAGVDTQQPKGRKTAKITNLMDALKASLAEAESDKKNPKKKAAN